MMMAPLRGPEPGRLLVRALLPLAGAGASVVMHECTPWSSATFTGTRHQLVLDCPDRDAAVGCAAMLPERDFALHGHLVADIVARVEGDALIVEALTLVAA